MGNDDRQETADTAADFSSLSRGYTVESPRPLVRIPETQPEVIENEYNFDPTRSVAQEYIPPASVTSPGYAAFTRLAPEARDECHDSLELQSSPRAVRYVLSLFERWKKSSDPQYPEPQELERLYRTAFGLQTPIRMRPDGPRPPAKPFAAETIAVVRSLYHVTQTLLRLQNDGRMTVYRGVRRRTGTELFAQVLDDPEREGFKIEADTVLNVTPSKAPAVDIGSNIVFTFSLPKEDVMMAVDQLRTGESPYSDEYHIRGGKVLLQQGSVVYALGDGDMWLPLRRLVTEAIRSEQQSLRVHDQLFQLVDVTSSPP